MKYIYVLGYKLIAFIFILSLFLQGCNNGHGPSSVEDQEREGAGDVKSLEKREEARLLLLERAKEGNVRAQFKLGRKYYKSWENHRYKSGENHRSERDFIDAERWLRKAAGKGHKKATELLATIERQVDYKEKPGVIGNEEEKGDMTSLLGRAMKGRAEAQYQLGKKFYQAWNRTSNPKQEWIFRATVWLTGAEAKGYEKATKLLRKIYERGENEKDKRGRDEKEKEEGELINLKLYRALYQRALSQDMEAQFELGKLIYTIWKQNGLKAAYEDAEKWLSQAESRGHEEAKNLLNELREQELKMGEGKEKKQREEEREKKRESEYDSEEEKGGEEREEKGEWEYDGEEEKGGEEREENLMEYIMPEDKNEQFQRGEIYYKLWRGTREDRYKYHAMRLLAAAEAQDHEEAKRLLDRIAEQENFSPLGDFEIFPNELISGLLGFFSADELVRIRMLNSTFYNLIFSQQLKQYIGLEINPENLPKLPDNLTSKRVIDFNTGILKNATPDQIPALLFYRMMGSVRNLPKEFWKFLKGSNIYAVQFDPHFVDNNITVEDIKAFVLSLAGTKVHTINLSGNDLETVIAFIQALKEADNTTVGRIVLDCPIVPNIARSLQGTNIHTVHIGRDHVSKNRVKIGKFARNLQGTAVRKVVMLGSISVANIGAQTVVEFMTNLIDTPVEELVLGYNKIKLEWAIKIAKALTGTNVKTLYLYGNLLTFGKKRTKEAREFAKTLYEQTQVRKVDLRNNLIAIKVIKPLLEEEFPEITWIFK